jgi:cysteine-rich repeat protein
VFQSLTAGSSWQAVGLTTTIWALAIDPASPATVYAGAYGVFQSLNGGGSWQATGLTDKHVPALAIDPAAPTTVYAGGAGVLKSLNGGSSWQATGLTDRQVVALAINPTTPTTLYAGAGPDGVFRSLNGGTSWSAVNTGLTSNTGWAERFVRALAIDPATPTTLYAGTSAGVFKSLNGGSSWQASGHLACGDGLVTCYEQCDDGNTVNGDGCDSNCTPTACGNRIVTPGEECDDGNTDPGDGCDANCQLELCGDAIVQDRLGEQCEDGNRVDGDGCDSNCTLTACGNGIVTTGEQCDDGNRNPFDGCTNECTVCGDGVVTAPEECDDGNPSGGDDCDAQCRRPHVVGTGTPQSCTETVLDAALAQRSVRFNCGSTPVTITLRFEKRITAATTIDGGGLVTLRGLVILSPAGAVRIFAVDESAALDLRNLTIAEAPGAVLNTGTMTLTNCTLSGNSVVGDVLFGGGAAIYNTGTMTLTNCRLSANSVVGGATSNGGGGAIYNTGTMTMMNCALSGNSAYFAGAISNIGTITLANCTLSGNSVVDGANRGGGAISNGGGTARLTNCTLNENGAAIWNGPSCNMFGRGCVYGSVTLANTIIAESAGPSCGGTDPITDGGHNLQFPDTSCGETISSLDPLLDPAGVKNNGGPTQTIALLPGSPAINAGDPDVCANPPVNGVDQRGYVRPGTGSSACSIGAYEYNSPGPPTVSCAGDCSGDAAVTIDELITLVNIALGSAQVSACMTGDWNGDNEITIDEILRAVNVALNGCTFSPAEQGCLTSAGTVTSASCCASSGDFPDTCGIGACGCAPAASHAVRVCDCGAGSCFDGSGCVRR